jgi:hypothetical protein
MLFGPLLIAAEHKAVWKSSKSSLSDAPRLIRDRTKLMYELLLSAHSFQQLVLPNSDGFKAEGKTYLFGWTLQGSLMSLYAVEFNVLQNLEFKFINPLKVFDCESREQFEAALEMSFLVCKYAAWFTEKIKTLNAEGKHFKDVYDLMRVADNLSSKTETSRKPADHSANPQDVSNIDEKQGDSSAPPTQSAVLLNAEAIKEKLGETGIVTMVKNRFSIGSMADDGFVVDRHADKIFNAKLLSNGADVVIKVVSRKTALFIQQLQSRFTADRGEDNDAEHRGFLFPIHYVFLDSQRCAIVMKAVEPLSRIAISIPRVVSLCLQLLTFLDWCRKLDIFHGDLKPWNMGLNQYGNLVVFDWEDGVLGTKGYCAPEVASGAASPDLISDLFAVGIILQELVDKLKAVDKADDRLQHVRDFIRISTSHERSKRSDVWKANVVNITGSSV